MPAQYNTDSDSDEDESYFSISSPHYTAEINCNDDRWRGIEALHDIILRALGGIPAPEDGETMELSVLLTDDAEIQQLNKNFREKDYATNVLSFPDGENGYLGDIAISFDRLSEESHNENKSFNDHFAHLLVHGCLHLMGYDHMDEEEAQEMESLEIHILRDMGIKNPYS